MDPARTSGHALVAPITAHRHEARLAASVEPVRRMANGLRSVNEWSLNSTSSWCGPLPCFASHRWLLPITFPWSILRGNHSLKIRRILISLRSLDGAGHFLKFNARWFPGVQVAFS